MMRTTAKFALVFGFTFALFAANLRAQTSGAWPPATPAVSAPQAAAPLRLEDLEQIALAHGPALAEAEARIRAAQGRKLQAGLYPNPIVGYTGDEISSGPVIRGGEHGFFVEQEIITAGKLGKSRSVFAQEEARAAAEAVAGKLGVLTNVRMLYYAALAAERRVELRGKLAEITREASDVSKQLANVGQADEPDVLEAEVEAERAELAREAAENDRQRVWQQLAAAVGVPSLPLSPLVGSLDDAPPQIEFDATLAQVLRESPEVKASESDIVRSEQAVKQARAVRIPNLLVRGGLRENRELLEAHGKPVGIEGFVDVGVRIPLFDRNQGSIQAAQAEAERALSGVERAKLALRVRLARAWRDYQNAKAIAQKYRTEILPRAQRAYDLYLEKFKAMEAAYPQVLIAQRNVAQLEVEYVSAEECLWQTVAEIRGLLPGGGVAPRPSTSAME